MKKLILLPALLGLLSLTLNAQRGRYHYDNRYNDRYRGSYYHNAVYRTPSVSIMASLPFGAVALNFGHSPYHYYMGRFYRPVYGGYQPIYPPIGIIVPSIPVGCSSIYIGSRYYYTYDGVYYSPYGSGYRVVENPAEVAAPVVVQPAPAQSTPVQQQPATVSPAAAAPSAEYEKIVLEGKTYYKKDGNYYKANVTADGEIVYQLVSNGK